MLDELKSKNETENWNDAKITEKMVQYHTSAVSDAYIVWI